MPDPSNSSFIPKRGPTNRAKPKRTSRQVFLMTIISYVVLFATLIAAGGIFIYSQLQQKKLNDEVVALNNEINSFSKSDMQSILEFNDRLQQAAGRVQTSVSVISIFDILEASTIDTVMLRDLTFSREADQRYVISAAINTDSFDSTIFQRGVYKRNQTLDTVIVSDFNMNVDTAEQGKTGDQTEGETDVPKVTFTAQLSLPISAIPYEPGALDIPYEPEALDVGSFSTEAEVVSSSTSDTEAVDGNNNTL